MTRVLSIDLETYSESDIGDCGVHKYCEDPAFEVMLFAYSEDYGPVQVVDLMSGEFIPRRITDMIFDPNVLKTAYNAPFERTALATHFGMECPAEQWECTMVLGAVSGYPLGLDKLSKALGLAEDKAKMSEGKRLIKYFCSPCKPTKNNGMRTRNMPWDDPEKWQKFIEYNRQDVVAENEIRKQLIRNRPDETEHKFWVLDQYINDTGIRIDMQLARNASAIGKEIKDGLIAQARRLTGLENPASNAQLKVWLEDVEGKEFPSLSKDAMPDVWAQLETEEAREVLHMREQWSLSSLAKYEAMLVGTCEDDHARGLFQFYGAARTGRFSGRRIQLQNLKRNNIKDLSLARQVVRDGDRELMELLFDGADTLSELVRTALIAEKESRFIVADFSAIEARVIAWFAGEEWVLDEFRGEGKIYEATASNMFHVPKELIVKGNPEYELRQKGKVATLACSYGGGVGALKAFGADKMGVSEAELQGLVDQWREANSNIVKWWKSLERAALSAVREKGRRVDKQGGIVFSFEEGDLYMTLPSGRRLCYPKAHITQNRFGNDSIGYWGQNQTTGQWCHMETYSGKLAENCLAGGTLVATDNGIKPIESVLIGDKLWDGRQWVPHEGLISKGIQKVIKVDGVEMTPDHRIYTERGWLYASQSAGLNRAKVELPDGYPIHRKRREEIAVGSEVRLRKAIHDACIGVCKGKTKVLRMHEECFDFEKAQAPWTCEYPDMECMALNGGKMHDTHSPSVEKLWRPWNQSMRQMARKIRELLRRYGTLLRDGADLGSYRCEWELRAGELPMDHNEGTGQKQTGKPKGEHAVGTYHSGRGLQEVRDWGDHPAIPHGSRMAGGLTVCETGCEKSVFDLKNAGPNHCFTVISDSGPLLVHNCTQAAARDCLRDSMLRLADAGYDIRAHVHDEVIINEPYGSGRTQDDVCAIMGQPVDWAPGLPLSAASYETFFYLKD